MVYKIIVIVSAGHVRKYIRAPLCTAPWNVKKITTFVRVNISEKNLSAVDKFLPLFMVSRMYVVLQETVRFCVTSYVVAQCGVIQINFSTSIKLQVGPTNAVYEMEPTVRTLSVKK